MVRIMCRSSFSPTTNNSSAIPNWAKRSTWSSADTQPSTDGPTRIPTAMKAMISGCRNRTPIAPMTAANNSSTAISVKTSLNTGFMTLVLVPVCSEPYYPGCLDEPRPENHQSLVIPIQVFSSIFQCNRGDELLRLDRQYGAIYLAQYFFCRVANKKSR